MLNRGAAIKIINRLHRSGFEALLAGGCVRDVLLCRVAKDYDVATDATPRQVIKLFKRTLKVGAKFGVVIVLLDDQQVEVATFRSEDDYPDGRRPANVTFTSAAEDAKRRDFTINGMFYDPIEKKIIDYVNGRADLEKEIVRTIGRPLDRFGEDYLRMLRAVRFSAKLGFKIERKTFAAICERAEKISKISGERIAMELESILTDFNRSAGVRLLIKSGLAGVIFPGFEGEKAEFAVRLLGYMRKRVDFPLAMAGFFGGCETDFALQRCNGLKLSRNATRHIKFLLAKRGKLLDSDMSLAQLKMLLASPYFADLYELQKSIQYTKAGGKSKRSIGALVKLKKRIQSLGDVELRPKPLLDGHDLMRLGVVSGPLLGQLAEEMYIAQLEGLLKTSKEAEKWAKRWLGNHKD